MIPKETNLSVFGIQSSKRSGQECGASCGAAHWLQQLETDGADGCHVFQLGISPPVVHDRVANNR